MKKLLITFILIISAIISFAQEVIATAGSNTSGTGIELSWTIGEPVTATTYGTDFILTQGFHQVQPLTAMFNQELSFTLGWNIMSARVIPVNKNLMDIFQPLIDGGILKKVMDEKGNIIEYWEDRGWHNTIGDIENTEGYKIKVASDISIEITGIPTQIPLDIPLSAGWNIMSWPSITEQSGMVVFDNLIIGGQLEKVMDEKGNIIEYWGDRGWQNTIGNLIPGEGYKVKVSSDCTLTINENGAKSEEIIQELIPSAHFLPAFEGNGTDHMNINLLNLSESGIVEGDEIGVFDGDICVGSAKITFQNSSISIPVSAADGIDLGNGYSEGNTIVLKLFRNGNEYSLILQPIYNGKTVFKKGSSLFAQVDLTTDLKKIPGSTLTEIKCYPNPFSNELTVEINLATDTEIQIEVLNQLGQRVKFLTTEKLFNNGTHRFIWDGKNSSNQQVSSGIYHLRVTVGESVIHRKIIFTAQQ